MFDDVFAALADKHRRFILSLLKTRNMNVSEILATMDVTGATLSHHLDILKRADLIRSERRGRFIWYRLNEPLFEEVMAHAQSFFQPSPPSPLPQGPF